MKKRHIILPAGAGVIFALILFYFIGSGSKMYAQTAGVQKTALTVPSGPSAAPKVTEINKFAAFAPAALQNSRSSTSLTWNFGGKHQTGWNLYSHLIGKTIGTESGPNTAEFAASLSEWQRSAGLSPTGIMDRDTFSGMIKFWQGQRLGRAAYPTADKLLAAPISEFYDPTRAPELLKLERETYAAYKRMLAEAVKDKSLGLKVTKDGELAPDEKFMRIVSAFRSREYQAQLRRQSPNSGRAGLAVHSPHFTGQALDIYVGGEPVITKDANRAIQVNTPVYKWLVKNAHKFGFYPYFYEPWHWEYVPGR